MATILMRAVAKAYRRGILPPRGMGKLFDMTPAWIWGGVSVEIQTEVGSMTVPLRDHGCRDILVFGRLRHESAETRLLSALARRVGYSVDIGANVGWYTRVLALGGGAVLAFEPNPASFSYLQQNAREFEGVEVRSVAIGGSTGTVAFYSAVSSDLSSSTRPVGSPIEVAVTTLDSATDQMGVKPDLVKCDVEGAEMEVLRGSKLLRSGPTAPVWLLEVDGEFLNEQGLTYEDLENEVHDVPGHISHFAADSDGRWVPLPHFADLGGTGRVNVLLVPNGRRELVRGLISP